MRFQKTDRFVVHVASALIRDNIQRGSTESPVWLIHPTDRQDLAVLAHGIKLGPSLAVTVPLSNALGQDNRTVAVLVTQEDVQVQLEREGGLEVA